MRSLLRLLLFAGLALAFALSSCGGEKAAFDSAMIPFDEGRMREAAESLSRFLDRYPDGARAPEALYQRAQVSLLYLDDLSSALSDLREIDRSFPRSERAFDARMRIAELSQTRLLDPARARTEYQRLLADFPDRKESAEVRFRLGELAYQELRFEEARGYLGQLAEGEGERAERASFRVAQSRSVEGSWSEAEAAWRGFLARFPGSAQALDASLGLAEALEQQGRGEEALALLAPLAGAEGPGSGRVESRMAKIRERMARRGR